MNVQPKPAEFTESTEVADLIEAIDLLWLENTITHRRTCGPPIDEEQERRWLDGVVTDCEHLIRVGQQPSPELFGFVVRELKYRLDPERYRRKMLKRRIKIDQFHIDRIASYLESKKVSDPRTRARNEYAKTLGLQGGKKSLAQRHRRLRVAQRKEAAAR
jgi:hypothetical protein